MPPKHESTKSHQNKYEPIPHELDMIGKKIVDAAYTVHKNLGPGLLDKVYVPIKNFLNLNYQILVILNRDCHELVKRGLKYQRQVDIPIVYDNLEFNEGLRLDVIVENSIICELKALETVNPVWEAQILSHLKLTGKRLGYLINFNVVNIGKGIKRFAL